MKAFVSVQESLSHTSGFITRLDSQPWNIVFTREGVLFSRVADVQSEPFAVSFLKIFKIVILRNTCKPMLLKLISSAGSVSKMVFPKNTIQGKISAFS